MLCVLVNRFSVFFLFCDSHSDDDIFLFLSFSTYVYVCLDVKISYFSRSVNKLNIGKFLTISNVRCYNNRFQLSWQIHSLRLKSPQIRKIHLPLFSHLIFSALWDGFTQSSMRWINFVVWFRQIKNKEEKNINTRVRSFAWMPNNKIYTHSQSDHNIQ